MAYLRATRNAAPRVLLAIVVVVFTMAACVPSQPSIEPAPFEPGLYIDGETGAELELLPAGKGEARDLVVNHGNMLTCSPGGTRNRYTGPITWKRYSEFHPYGVHIYITYENMFGAVSGLILNPQSVDPENWDVLLSLPCGDPDAHAPFRYVKVADPPEESTNTKQRVVRAGARD